MFGRISIFENLINWQSKVGYVPQENFLINDSIKNNICFGEDEEKIDNKKFRIGFVGRIEKEKGLKKFLEIAYENKNNFTFNIFSDSKLNLNNSQKK